MTLRELLRQRADRTAELRRLHDEAGEGELATEQRARFDTITAELETLEQRIARQAAVEDAERRAAGTPLGETGDTRFDAELRSFSIIRALGAAIGLPGVDAGRERELSAEVARRSGRSFSGVAVPLAALSNPVERRVLGSTSPIGGAGGSLIPTETLPVVDRLRPRLIVGRLGATMLADLTGDVTIPRLKDSATSAWVAEGNAIPKSDPKMGGIQMRPRMVAGLTEISRSLLVQTSQDAERVVRDDLARVVAEALDRAALAGTGIGAEPRGLLNDPDIGSFSLATVTWAAVLEAIADVEIENAEGSGWATHPRVVQAMRGTLRVSGDAGAGFIMEDPRTLAGYPLQASTVTPTNLGGGANKTALVFGDWSALLIGMWGALDLVANPYGAAFNKGGVEVRAIAFADVGLRHPKAFSAAKDAA